MTIDIYPSRKRRIVKIVLKGEDYASKSDIRRILVEAGYFFENDGLKSSGGCTKFHVSRAGENGVLNYRGNKIRMLGFDVTSGIAVLEIREGSLDYFVADIRARASREVVEHEREGLLSKIRTMFV